MYYSNNDTSQANYEALGDDIDFESDGITCCLETTFDNATDNTNDMLRMNQ